jgi:transcriptional regulator with XRE-family HTH domain
MIKGIEYTSQMDLKIIEHQNEYLLTTKELATKAGLAESSIYKFRNRGKISVRSIKKIQENLGVPLLTKLK